LVNGLLGSYDILNDSPLLVINLIEWSVLLFSILFDFFLNPLIRFIVVNIWELPDLFFLGLCQVRIWMDLASLIIEIIILAPRKHSETEVTVAADVNLLCQVLENFLLWRNIPVLFNSLDLLVETEVLFNWSEVTIVH